MLVPRMRGFSVRNFRSIGNPVRIRMPERGPLVLLGENNAGKSNLIRALEIVLGETWPGSFQPEDHDYYLRNRDFVPMEIAVDVSEVTHTSRSGWMDVCKFEWTYDPENEDDRNPSFDVLSREGGRQWGSNATREQLSCVVVGADRRLSYQMSYASKWTLLSRLMRRFHEALVSDDERTRRLTQAFLDTVAIFNEVPEFEAFSNQLRRMATELGANLRYGLDMDFSAYDPSNYFRSLRVLPSSGGEIRDFDELGTGQEQILALAFAYAYAKAYGSADSGLVMVIEEPESHLHPLAQQWLGRKVIELCDEGVQIILTTHSSAFIDLSHPDGIVCVRKL